MGPTGSSAVTPCLQHYLVSWSLGDWVRQRDMNITCDFASFQREALDQGWGCSRGRHWDVEPWFVQKAILGATHQHCQRPLKPQARNSQHSFGIHSFINSLSNDLVSSAGSGVRPLGLNPSSAIVWLIWAHSLLLTGKGWAIVFPIAHELCEG